MSRPKRIDGFEYRGLYQYFLTFCVRDRRRVFSDRIVAHLVIDHFLRTAKTWDFAVLAYCIMPDHVHLLVEGISESSDLRRFVKRLKQIARYVVDNPVRAGLAQSPTDYPHVGSGVWSMQELLYGIG